MSATESTVDGRRYRGLTGEERRAERRRRLEAAAMEIAATRGWSQATMTEICRTAGLTERYFYESFGSREDLYAALIDDLDRELRAAAFDVVGAEDLDPGVRLEAAIRAIVALYGADPVRGRAALVEAIGDRELEERRRRAVHGLFGLLAERWLAYFPAVELAEDERRVRATAVGGAVMALIAARLEGQLRLDDEALVRSIVVTATAIATARALA